MERKEDESADLSSVFCSLTPESASGGTPGTIDIVLFKELN
jgi:hypothetical protein